MTVCIGAICEDGKTAVVAADKMVVFGAPMNLQTEPATLRKIMPLTEDSVLLYSGSLADGEDLIRRSGIQAGQNLPIEKIAQAIKSSFTELKKTRVEETILQPLLGADYQQFQALAAQSPSSQILQQVVAMMMQHNLNLDVLIAGVDESGGHLFVVTHPGVLLRVDTTAFAAIGVGGTHAMVRLSLGGHTKVASREDTIYNVYEAKKASEVAPGVGKLTDLAVVERGKVCFADQRLFDVLEKAHKERPILSTPEQEELRKVCNEWTKAAAN